MSSLDVSIWKSLPCDVADSILKLVLGSIRVLASKGWPLDVHGRACGSVHEGHYPAALSAFLLRVCSPAVPTLSCFTHTARSKALWQKIDQCTCFSLHHRLWHWVALWAIGYLHASDRFYLAGRVCVVRPCSHQCSWCMFTSWNPVWERHSRFKQALFHVQRTASLKLETAPCTEPWALHLRCHGRIQRWLPLGNYAGHC